LSQKAWPPAGNERRFVEREMKKKITACLVIPTFNREEVLVDTVKSALALDPPPDEILVIDQTVEHQTETSQFLQTAHDQGKIRWIRHSPPNLCGARNRAKRETRCDILIFIDDDVELPKDFAGQHLKNYADDRVEAVAGRIRQTDESRYGKSQKRKSWPRLFDYKYFRLNSLERVEGVATFMGANHSVTARIMERLGGYDTNYLGQVFRDDTDFAIRIWKAGGRIIYDPDANLLHLCAPSGGARARKGSKPVEWKVAFPRNYFAWHHLFPKWEFWWMTLFMDQRETALRKYNLFRPWRIPWAVLSYWYSVVRAGMAALKRKKDEAAGLTELQK
jgi:GT2 family glycosyltransferase